MSVQTPVGGPRSYPVLGNLLEMQLTLATILQRFEPQLVSGYPVELQAGITLRPKNGVLMTLKRRSQNPNACRIA